jgi:tRNA (guanine37-N1)-methyltransferase
LHIAVLTLFPGMFEGVLGESIVKLALEKGLVSIELHNLRDWGLGARRTVDDRPYGGGPGMVLRPEPVFAAVEAITAGDDDWRFVLLTPQGRKYSHSVACGLAGRENLLLICGHYEGFDERVRLGLPVDEISVGDFVTTGGEIPAMTVIDTVVRQIPGVLGNEQSTDEESFGSGLIEYPQYTRPPEFRGMEVPEILLSGNHAEIAKWRKEQSLERTRKRRPDLLE